MLKLMTFDALKLRYPLIHLIYKEFVDIDGIDVTLSGIEWQKICCVTGFNRGNCENAHKMDSI